jgi:hypothetical protein
MFAKTIIDSDAFLDMPLSTQALYFHLVIRANEKGLLNNLRSICKMLGCNKNDIDSLIKSKFIDINDSGIYEIKNWDIVIGRAEIAKKRLTYKYRQWRESVLKRDNYVCKKCGSNLNLEAHHIKKFSEYENERYNIDNGITLCKQCHVQLHKQEVIKK